MAKPDYYDAADCDTHEKGAPKFCKKSEPGEGAERSCAYDGARVVLMPITDVIHLVHGPIACAGNSWDNRGARSSGSQLYRRGFTTEMLENDVVFGGEKKLYRAILELAERYEGQAKAMFVYATCVTAMTGDDIEAVCAAAGKKISIPLIPVNTPGFIGDKNIGNRLAGEVLFKHVIGTAEPPVLGDYPINLIGEYNIAGDLWGMLPLFERLGIQVLSCFSGDAKFEELRYAHRAKLNIIICSKSLTNLAKKMQKNYGMPYLEESFYGMTDTAKALRDIARELDDAVGGLEKRTMQDRVERLLEEEEAKCRERLAPYRERLEGKRSVLFTGGVKTWSMVNALRELGVEILAAGTQNSTLEDFYRMKALMHQDARIIEDTSSAGLLQVMYDKMPDLIVAGGKTKFLALKTKTPFLDINHGRSHPYAGYEGMVTFAKQLDLTVNNPIWPVLNAPAPWEKSGEELAAAVAFAAGHAAAHLAEDLKDSKVKVPAKNATVNPQKNSPALGATLAYLGIDQMLALLHGAQGCSTFIRLQLSRHFKEPIALNSTAMSEDTAIFGGWENLKKGLKKVIEKFSPEVVGVMTSGLTETMGDDVRSAIVHFRQENPEHDGVPIVWASTPDYCGSLQEGYAAAVEAIVRSVPESGETLPGQVTVLPGAHLTPADVEEVREICEAFGLDPIIVPDIANALDGHIDETVSPLSTGGVSMARIREAGRSCATIFIGDSLAKAAEALTEKCGMPNYGFTSITGLAEVDRFMETLSAISGRPIPEKFRRWRSRLMDAMVDSHYQFGLKKVTVALEADNLKTMAGFLSGMGCEIQAAIAATRVRGLDALPAREIFVGDLEDLETAARGSDLVVANSNGRQAAAKLGIKAHLRAGLPVFDRLGAHQKMWVGYRGTMNLLFETANLFQANASEGQKLAHN
ncbi:bifunctional nitrogenase iron-molybdenum cofactor biosynthesis protein NifEN [Geobacter hydrogenophilus]|uniref:Nitrogenase iron-molybdenum cofactor biosynthesis protein NifE n=1 Tax=Geobacter hydrogenophilus TaxID=40983 RepID=A0A9W6G1L1_9BACT|nr:bifunctional nitrogenase iron-molybdenum cofactor biosynthesis protein NifEN [Geobacter hydrogenophilus]MBT0892823.1 bifunctional nitrogenase iron-molybdenum cofactor biosynthesis protein NifEN [Geobacter hydrogenophilus]GLI38703.1 bifunctional nitrogenase iron-molybdenum cofactor biosynthesis protein NifEN [Geobacter hydrogenophilus]